MDHGSVRMLPSISALFPVDGGLEYFRLPKKTHTKSTESWTRAGSKSTQSKIERHRNSRSEVDRNIVQGTTNAYWTIEKAETSIECQKQDSAEKMWIKRGLNVVLPPLPHFEVEEHVKPAVDSSGDLSDRYADDIIRQNAKTRLLPGPYSCWPSPLPSKTPALRNPFGGNLPLTPPHEPVQREWLSSDPHCLTPRTHSLSSEQGTSTPELSAQQTSSSGQRPPVITLPGYVNMSNQGGSPSTWLERAVSTIGKFS
jgi:hypothetical protein